MFHLLAAYLTLLLPSGTPITEEDIRHFHGIAAVAVQVQIMDEREMPTFMAILAGVVVENEEGGENSSRQWWLDTMRERLVDLRDAPFIENIQRFPDRLVCDEVMQFNRKYQSYLTDRLDLLKHRQDDIWEASCKARKICWIWELARDSKADFYYLHVRRRWFLQLKELLGDEAYYAGRMPPPVPLEYFDWAK